MYESWKKKKKKLKTNGMREKIRQKWINKGKLTEQK